MAEPFISEIRIFGFGFAPKGWAMCNGQILSIAQNTALFSLLGTTYGGNGTTTFALPNLQSRTGVSFGQGPGLSNYNLGEVTGEATHTLATSEMPSHSHPVNCSSAAGSSATPGTNVWAADGTHQTMAYAPPPATLQAMSPAGIGIAGQSVGHENVQPFLVLNICIALVGVFPSRN
jgi:microcystin-dependent protein